MSSRPKRCCQARRHWVSSSLCVMHTCHKSMRWSLSGELERGTTRDCWIVCEALQKRQHIFEDWACQHIAFSDYEGDAAELWSMLGAIGDPLGSLSCGQHAMVRRLVCGDRSVLATFGTLRSFNFSTWAAMRRCSRVSW